LSQPNINTNSNKPVVILIYFIMIIYMIQYIKFKSKKYLIYL